MELIDKRKLKNHYSWWQDDKQKTFDSIVDQQPVVEAIPVNWIIRWNAEHMEFGTVTVEKMLEDWKNVQEEA